MKRHWRKDLSHRHTDSWVTGIALVLGVGMSLLALSVLPSARRYLRLRAM